MTTWKIVCKTHQQRWRIEKWKMINCVWHRHTTTHWKKWEENLSEGYMQNGGKAEFILRCGDACHHLTYIIIYEMSVSIAKPIEKCWAHQKTVLIIWFLWSLYKFSYGKQYILSKYTQAYVPILLHVYGFS